MDKENRIEQICENCKHFRRFYVKRSDKFKATGYGYCVRDSIKSIRNFRYRKVGECSLWELTEEGQPVDKSVKNLLGEIAVKLDNVKYLLTFTDK